MTLIKKSCASGSSVTFDGNPVGAIIDSNIVSEHVKIQFPSVDIRSIKGKMATAVLMRTYVFLKVTVI